MPSAFPLLLRVCLLGVMFLAVPARAQQGGPPPVSAAPPFQPQEVGIDEKLGGQIPLDLALRDEAGRTVKLGALLDKPTILTLNYFSCAGICTPLLNGVTEVLNSTRAQPGVEFQVITVSFDERDTPEIAATKRTNYLREIHRPFPPSAWRFLTGDAANTRTLCDSVGFKFKQDGEGFVHAGAIVFLSPQGRVTRYMYGTTFLPADLQLAVQEAARGEAQPTISKWLKICFSSDPAGRKFAFSFTKVAAVLTILAAAVFAVVLARKGRRQKDKEGEQA
jgi:protein SCO1